jgi:hypothetical protein
MLNKNNNNIYINEEEGMISNLMQDKTLNFKVLKTIIKIVFISSYRL